MKTLMIASDYDGTICVDGKISDADREAIARFRAMGHKFGLVTGRLRQTAHMAADTIEHDFVICCSGGVILGKDREMRHAASIPTFPGLGDLFALAKDCGCVNFLIDASSGLYSYDVQTTSPEHVVLPEDARIYEVCFYIPGQSEEKTARFVEESERFKACFEIYLNGGSVDMPVKGVSKETGIIAYAEMEGIERENIFAVGDQTNDLPMIRAFDSYAVSNAHPALKAEAKHACNRIADMIEDILSRQD